MIKTLLAGMVSLVLVTPVGAQGVINGEPTLIRDQMKSGISDFRKEAQDELQKKREELQMELKRRQEEMRLKMQSERDEFKKEVESKREEVRVKIEQKQAELKTRLQSIKDERKKTTVEKIDNRIDELNKKHSNHFNEVLDKLALMLDRIVSRTEKAAGRGLDTASVTVKVEAARAAIAAARTAVTAQMAKTYPINVTTEANLRSAASSAMKALEADLKLVREKVKAAHDAVRVAAVTLAQIPRVDEVATSTPPVATTTPTNSN